MKQKLLILFLLASMSGLSAFAQSGKTIYEYDELNRLIKVVSPAGETVYTYDELCNRTAKQFKVDENLASIRMLKDYGIMIIWQSQKHTLSISGAKSGEPCLLLNMGGVTLAKAIADSNGSAEFKVPVTGAYVVQVGKRGEKIMCK